MYLCNLSVDIGTKLQFIPIIDNEMNSEWKPGSNLCAKCFALDAMPLILEIITFCKKYNRDKMNTVMYAKYDCTATMNTDLERGENLRSTL